MKSARFLLLLALPFIAPSAAGGDDAAAASPDKRLACAISSLSAQGGGALLAEGGAADASKVSASVSEWLQVNGEALRGVGASPFKQKPAWGTATTRGDNLYLHVANWPEGGKLEVPRLHNSVLSLTLIGKTKDAKQLKLSPGTESWTIKLPSKAAASLLPIVRMQLDQAPRLVGSAPPLVSPGKDGQIILHARDSMPHGKMLRFEPQTYKNTVGYWVKADDWVEWSFRCQQAGKYELMMRFGCGNGHAGSDIGISCGTETLKFHVEATGGFQAWREVSVGQIELKAGEQKLRVKPIHKAKAAVMDIQQIWLRPLGAG